MTGSLAGKSLHFKGYLDVPEDVNRRIGLQPPAKIGLPSSHLWLTFGRVRAIQQRADDLVSIPDTDERQRSWLTTPDILFPVMRYVLKQKFWSWGDDFTIKNAAGEDVFFVDGRAFSWGDKLSFQDMKGTELAFIRQKLLSWGPTYEIEVHDRLVAIVKKHLFTLLRCKFTVDVPGPDDLGAQGNFLDHEYSFERHGKTVASVSKRWFSCTDTYGIDITPGEDDVLILASAVVIDMVCHQESKPH